MAKHKTLGPESSENGTRKEQALERIRSDLFSGKLKPGSIISATGLAEELPFSRTPIREAMEVLAVEGLIEWMGASGAVIRTVRPDDLVEIMTLRYGIETQVAEKLAREHDDYKISVLETLMEQLHQKGEAAAKGDEVAIKEFHDLDIEFHRTMARLAGMPLAEVFVKTLMDHFRLLGLEKQRFKPLAVCTEHQVIVDSIAKPKGDNVRRMVRKHVINTCSRWAPDVAKRLEDLQ